MRLTGIVPFASRPAVRFGTDEPVVKTVTDENFEAQVLARSHRQPVVVDFYADWCPACNKFESTLMKVADANAHQAAFAKFDVNSRRRPGKIDLRGVARRYQVTSIPTILVFRNGEMVERATGNLPAGDLQALINQHL